MSFLNPTLLIGLAAALVPLVLHLLSRARYQNVEWGAMMFLDSSFMRQKESGKLKQWVLLGLRMGTVALLAAALARPVVQEKGTPLARSSRAAAVILLDRSASMALIDNGRARLEMAREAVFQILPGLHKGDDVWLLPMGEPVGSGLLHDTDPQDIARHVKEFTPASGQADVAAALEQAITLLENAGPITGEIYIVGDRQATSWKGVDAAFAAAFRGRAARLAIPPRVFAVPVGTDESDNVAIESVEFARPPVIADQPADVDVRVRNFAAAPRAAVQVAVQRGSERMSLPVNLTAGGTATVRLHVTFPEAGPQTLVAELDASGLASDKRLTVAVDVLRDLRVLIVDGDEHEGAFRSESDFLRLALAPYRVRRKDPAVVDVISPDDWDSVDFSSYQAVILTNVPSFTEPQAQTLERFVYDGGGLLVAPGDRSRVDNYNERLFRYHDGILPAALLAAVPDSDVTATAVGTLDPAHPAFAFLRNRPDAAVAAVVRRYFPVLPRGDGAKVIASYSEGAPFLIELQCGHGRVLLMTTSVDIDWNTLALTNFFLPFAQSCIRYLATARAPRLNLAPGEPLVAEISEPLDPGLLAVQLPDRSYASPASVTVIQSGSQLVVTFGETSAVGAYRLFRRRNDPKPLAIYVVATPRTESDLKPLSPEQWKTLEHTLGLDRIDADRGTIAAAQELARTGWNLWLPGVAAVVLLSLSELVIARRWSRAES